MNLNQFHATKTRRNGNKLTAKFFFYQVGDILTGLSGEDDEELLESLTAEIGEQFNILEYADPELANLNDAEHILDGLELADDVPERHAKREPE